VWITFCFWRVYYPFIGHIYECIPGPVEFCQEKEDNEKVNRADKFDLVDDTFEFSTKAVDKFSTSST